MHRLVALRWIAWDLYSVGEAMLDGSYWSELFDPGPPEFVDRGSFSDGGGD